jgi:transcriptional regulator with XRE-family HTH domain
MWRESIIEAKKAKNITTKTMSEKVRLPEQTIARILSGKTETPRIDTVLDLGAAVGLSPWELFAETTAVLGDKNLSALQEELDQANAALSALQAEFSSLSAETTELRVANVTLQAENDMLRTKLEHKEEIIELHNYYKSVISGMTNNPKGGDAEKNNRTKE